MKLKIYETEYFNHIFCDSCVRNKGLKVKVGEPVDVAFENDTCDLCGCGQYDDFYSEIIPQHDTAYWKTY